MNRLLRDLISGAAFGVGLMAIRILFGPVLLVALGGAFWAIGWALLHHAPYLVAMTHVAVVSERWVRAAWPGGA